MKKETKLLAIIVIITVMITIVILIIIGYFFKRFVQEFRYDHDVPDDLYIKMREINDNKSLIGLSETEVIELLGEPRYEYEDRDGEKNYTYSAGKIVKVSILGNHNGTEYYELEISFDKNNKVEYTYIQMST